MRVIGLTLLFLLSHFSGLHANAAERWRVVSFSIDKNVVTPQNNISALSLGTLTAVVTNETADAHIQIVSNVPLTHATNAFVSNGKLAVLGEAGKTNGVVIFDVVGRNIVDWFYCYGPHQISDDWIVYVEWYPPRGTGEPKDVLLLYDLSKTPLENRLPSARRLNIPVTDLRNIPVQVGVPIYPHLNAQEHSYVNRVKDLTETETIVQSASYLLLPQQRLVFVAAQGPDFSRLVNYLVIVNLSHGSGNPSIERVDIPKGELKMPGENPQFVHITGMQSIAAGELLLYIPESEYGISSITVQIPDF